MALESFHFGDLPWLSFQSLNLTVRERKQG